MARTVEGTDNVELGGREPKTDDLVGKVRIYLSLNDSKTNKPVKSNITSALYIKGAKVSDVQKRIVEAFSAKKK